MNIYIKKIYSYPNETLFTPNKLNIQKIYDSNYYLIFFVILVDLDHCFIRLNNEFWWQKESA